jgi:hypothetical protein
MEFAGAEASTDWTSSSSSLNAEPLAPAAVKNGITVTRRFVV